MKKCILSLLFFCLIASTFAQKGEEIPVDPKLKMGKLENGLTYYLHENSKPENTIELRLAVNAGSILEDEDQKGLAHFVEHMAFNGTKNFKKSELVDFLESVGTRFGADLNAYTSFDETVYMLQVRSVDTLVDKGLTVMEDWAGGLLFDHEEIDKERGVVESEWRTRLGAGQRMQNKTLPVMYKGSHYAKRLPIGDTEIINNAPYDNFKRFYRDWYRPNLMALVIVGDIDVEEMEKEVIKRFSSLKNPENERPRKEFDVPMHKETLVAIEQDKEATGSNVTLMYKHPRKEVKDMADYRESLIRSLYNRMLNARLSEIGQQGDPPYLFAYSFYGNDLGDIDAYQSYASTPEGGTLRALEVLMLENKRVRDHGFLQSELDRNKEELMTYAESQVKEQDKTDSRRFASRYVSKFLNNTPTPSADQYYAILEKHLPTITLEEVNQIGKDWITDENRVVVITGPEKEESVVPEESEVRNILDKVEGMEVEPYEDNVSDAPFFDKELEPGLITSMMEMEDVGITKLTLDNGVEVFLKPTDFKNDEILMTATSEGGNSLYSDDLYPSSSNASSIVNEGGVGAFDLIQLDKKLSGKEVRVSPYIGTYYEGMRGFSSPDDVETMFQLIYMYFNEPRKDEDAYNSFKSKQMAFMANMMSNPNFYFSDMTNKIKYNDHPRAGFPTKESFEQMNLDEAYRIYKERFADASDFAFFFVGSFDVEEMKPMIEKYLGNLPSINRDETWKDIGLEMQKGVVEKTITRGEAPKSNVEIMFHGDAEWNSENRYAMRSLIEVLRIKLRESMREDKGGVYGVRVSGGISHYPKERYSITISFNADPERADELANTAIEGIRNAMANGAEQKDLDKVAETQRQTMIKSLKENRYWNRQMESAYENGTKMENIKLEKLEEQIATLNSDLIKNAANKFFDFDNYFRFVMHPEASKEEKMKMP
jgi:zinc protease